MKIIEPKVEEIKDFEGVDNFYKAAARAARICYASDKTDNDKELCERLIKLGHHSPFEHAIISIKDDYSEQKGFITDVYMYVYSHDYTIVPDGKNYIITNGRVIVESVIKAKNNNNCSSSTIELLDSVLDYFKKNEIITNEFKSFIVDTSIGCTRELNRHDKDFYYTDPLDICEQSTRFCNFSKDKFGNEVAFNKPYWYDEASVRKQNAWKSAMLQAEYNYINNQYLFTIDEIRGVLPLDTHTRAIYTSTISEWNHIIDLRLRGTTGTPHGDINIIAEKINNLINGI